MVQLTYFGDSRDYFKYDLITSILKSSSFRNYVFVPMLTERRVDNEGKKESKNTYNKSDKLLDFIKRCKSKSLAHWEKWLSPYVDTYNTIPPVDKMFFTENTREYYWERFEPILKLKEALIFIDPDIGLETGSPAYLKKMGKEKYILNSELEFLINTLRPSSALMIYQHLQNDNKKRNDDVIERLSRVSEVDNKVSSCAYREDDLAFLLSSKTMHLHTIISKVLSQYHNLSTCRNKHIVEMLPKNIDKQL